MDILPQRKKMSFQYFVAMNEKPDDESSGFQVHYLQNGSIEGITTKLYWCLLR